MLDQADGNIDMEPGTWVENGFARMRDLIADENCEEGGDLKPNGDEQDCDLAGSYADLELDDAYYEGQGFITGGQGL